jgi:maltooligosyltrehalose trehalohydrolase
VEPHRTLWLFYQTLLELRGSIPALRQLDKSRVDARAREEDNCLIVARWSEDSRVLMAFNFDTRPRSIEVSELGDWEKLLDSAEQEWGGPGTQIPDALTNLPGTPLNLSATSFALFRRL